MNLLLSFLEHPPKASLVIFGQLSKFFAKLSTIPPEHTLQDIHVLTSKKALVNYLGWDFSEISSLRLSTSLAAASYARVKRLFPNEVAVGISCVIPLTSIDHTIINLHESCYITVWSKSSVWTYVISLHDTTHTRESKDSVLSTTLLNALKFKTIKPQGLQPHDFYYIQHQPLPTSAEDLLSSPSSNLLFYGTSTAISNEPLKTIIYPYHLLPKTYQDWSFLNKVKTQWNLPLVFEMPVDNSHYDSFLVQGIKTLEKLEHRLIVTKNLSFGQKAKLFHQSLFVITEDILYELCQDDLVCTQDHQCQFLVLNMSTSSQRPQIVEKYGHLFLFSDDELFTR